MESHRALLKEFSALNHYKHSLVIKAYEGWTRVCRVKRGSRVLGGVLFRVLLAPSFFKMKAVSVKTGVLQRDWREHREMYRLQQMLAQWREHAVKQKLARMLVKKRALRRLRTYIFRKNFQLPLHQWTYYRKQQIFSVLNQYK